MLEYANTVGSEPSRAYNKTIAISLYQQPLTPSQQYIMSQSSLIPEQPLVISPSLAATIGLEEAVLLQQLSALIQHRTTMSVQGFQWMEIDRPYLEKAFPFWSAVDLHRVSKSLADKGIILIDSPPLHSTESLKFAINEKQEVVAPDLTSEKPIKSTGANLISSHWSPSEEMLQLLTLNHQVSREFSLGQLEDFVLYWRERSEVSHAWENKFRQHILSRWRHQQQQEAEQQVLPTENTISQAWRPSEDALEILLRNAVNRQFIDDAVPEFILYWRERGENTSTWNSKFIAHIRRQWARFTSSLEHDTEPHRIADSWHPTEDVYDILHLANIDAKFAQGLVSEFVLFWKDSNQAHSSWNTKYLQHVKYHWAKRHQLVDQNGKPNAGQQRHRTGSTRARSLAEDLTDRSWAG